MLEYNDVVIEYLDKHYYVVENCIINTHTEKQEWGDYLVLDLKVIFSIDAKTIYVLLKEWLLTKNVNEEQLNYVLRRRKLKTHFNADTINNLKRYGVYNSEEPLINILIKDLSNEIDVEKLVTKNYPKTMVCFESMINCLGFEINYIRNNITNLLYGHFFSLPYQKIQNERHNNPYW